MAGLPLLIKAVHRSPCNASNKCQSNGYRYGMLILTFFCYMSYHISRKPISIVKGQLHRNCSYLNNSVFENPGYGSQDVPFSLDLPLVRTRNSKFGNGSNNDTWCDFPPFDQSNYKSLFGQLDYAFLFTYAIGMFFSGIIAERLPLRYFLSAGMVLSGIFTAMFGIGYFKGIHTFSFYIAAQVLNGLFQTTGWPAVVACVGNWFGKERRGLIMGIWNSHTSFGNIIGSVIASAFVGYSWGLSFVVPGIIIGSFGIIAFFTLIEKPEDLGVQYEVLSNQEQATENSPIHVANGIAKHTYGGVIDDSHSDNDEIQTEPLNENVTVEHKAIGFIGALTIPGVVEFALCLLFAKLVSYTFLFWLPFYLQNTSTLTTAQSGLLSTLFDVGGIFGGIMAGVVSDKSGGRATTCGVMLLIGAVMMFIFNSYGTVSMAVSVVLLLITGAFVNGPYALITTAVSADLGTHEVLKGNSKALSTVTAIIDGTGSIGAAIGPLLTGVISPSGWNNVFWMLIASNILAVLLLTRLILKEVSSWMLGCRMPHITPEDATDEALEIDLSSSTA